MNNRNHNKENLLTEVSQSRIIGRIDGTNDAPAVLAFAGMHGNEPAGIEALERIFDELDTVRDKFRGTFVGVCANLRATDEGIRFVDEDMNRIWFPSIIDKIRRCTTEELNSSERQEIKKLLYLIESELSTHPERPLIFVDLHTFSAEGCMFAITSRKEQNIDLLSAIHVPMAFGIEEALRGTALRYFQDREITSFAIEGGNHQNNLTVYNITAALILLLCKTGNMSRQDLPGFETYEEHISQHTSHLPSKVEFVYQHIIEPGDEFEMRPGFTNFQPVREGEWLASDRNGQIRAQCNGFLLMPLYQSQGDDGFFIVQESV